MLRRPRFTGLTNGSDHDDTVDMLVRLNRQAHTSAHRNFRYLCEYYEANAVQFEEEAWEANLIRAHWQAEALRLGYCPTTVRRIGREMGQLNMDPRDHRGTNQRIEAHLIIAGINRLASGHVPTNVRAEFSLETLWAPLISGCRNRTARQRNAHTDCRTAWFLCIATGCRIGAVFEIKAVRVLAHGIAVHWGRRKASEADRQDIWYPALWSRHPPDDVINRLLRINAEHPVVCDHFADPSKAVLEWLRRHQVEDETPLGTSDARTRMVCVLRRHVERGEMTESRYKKYLDHLFSTSEKNYRIETLRPEVVFDELFEEA